MLKVFLVEDEYAIREGIRKSVHWEREGFELVGEAGDGEIAFPQILASEPDILITDIRMPFMDGLELSRLVKSRMPDVHILVISGYDDFSYAQEAIRIGVEDYLLKPLSEASLLKKLAEIGARIREERLQHDADQQYLREREEIRTLEREKYFHELVDGRLSMQQALEQGAKLEVDITAAWYDISLFQARTVDTDHEVDDISAGMWQELNADICGGAEQCGLVRLFEESGGTLCFLVMADSLTDLEGKETAWTAFVREQMGLRPQLRLFMATGRPVERLRDIRGAYELAGRRFAQRYLQEESMVLCGSADESGRTAAKQPDYLKLDVSRMSNRYVLNYLRGGSAAEAEEFVKDFFGGLGKEAGSSYLLRQYVLMGTAFCIISFLESLGYSREEINGRIGNLQELFGRVGTIEETADSMKKCLLEAIRMRNQNADRRYTLLIDQAKNYILDNYAQESISLQTAAASVNLSPSHFSTVFRQETGETFIEFLTGVRMEKAKELLICTSMKTADVGSEVGYRDPHYFSYLFKKTTGISPKDYRSQHLKETT